MFASGLCRTTVSILEAIIFGTNGACIDLSMPSVYWAALAFVIAVVVLKILGKVLIVAFVRNLRRKPGPAAPTPPAPDAKPELRLDGTPGYDGGPIRSTRAR